MLRWLWALLALASFAGVGVLAAAKQMAPVVIALATISWFFIAVALGGKKGLPFGVGILVFVACVFGLFQIPRLFGSSYNWTATKQILDTLADKPGEIVLIYLGLISLVLVAIIVPPIFVGRKLWKSVAVPRRVSAVAQPPAESRPGRARRKEPDVGQP